MRRQIYFILAAVMILTSLGSLNIFAADAEFSDNFESGFLKWHVDADSKFSVRKSDTMKLVFIDNGDGIIKKALANADSGNSYTLEFELDTLTGKEFDVYLNYKDDKNYYLLNNNINNGATKLIRRADGGGEETVKSGKLKLDKKFNKIEITVIDGKMTVTSNGEGGFEAPVSGNGKFGFSGKGGSYNIDNVKLFKQKSAVEDIAAAGSVARLTPPSDLNGTIDGTTTQTDFESRKAELPKEVDLVDLVPIKGETEIFIAPNGNDDNPGTIDKPFKTFKRAVTEVNILNTRKPKPKGIVVYLREGNYQIDETMEFGSVFSGTSENPLIISAYNGEKVSFATGALIKESQMRNVKDSNILKRLKPEVRDKVLTINLGQMIPKGIGDNFKQMYLYANGNSMTMARYPNNSKVQMGTIIRPGQNAGTGTVHLDIPSGVVYEMFDKTPMNWEDTGEMIWNGAFAATWDVYRTKIKKIDKAAGTIETFGQSWALPAVSSASFTHFYENVLEEIDLPGEWAIDGKHMNLYVYPYDIEGDTEYSFVHSSNHLMTFNKVKNVVINGITIEHSGGKGIYFKESEGCIVQNCTIMNTNECGVMFLKSYNCGAIDNYFYNAGINDKRAINFAFEDSDSASAESVVKRFTEKSYKNIEPSGNFAQNNIISSSGGAGIKSTGFPQMVTSHNTVIRCKRDALYVTQAFEAITEYNEVAGTPFEVKDAGTFYMAGPGWPTGSHIRYNYFHDPMLEGNAIYLDEGTSGVSVYGNVGVDYVWCGMASNGGRDIATYNNIFIQDPNSKYKGEWRYGGISNSMSFYWKGGGSETQWLTKVAGSREASMMKYAETGTTLSDRYIQRFPRYVDYVKENIAALEEREAGIERGPAELKARFPGGFYVENNIVVGKGKNIVLYEDEEGVGSDPHIVKENFETDDRSKVGFVDYKNHDYTLKADSPVYEVIPDFENIDVSKSGIVRDNGRWKTIPQLVKPSYIVPLDNSVGEVYHKSVEFMWTYQALANKYELIISTDPDFDNIIYRETTSHNSLKVELPEAGKQYYWKVKASTTLQSLDLEPKESSVYTFTTMSAEDALGAKKYNSVTIDNLIDRMERKYNTIIEDGQPGNYKPGAKAMLKAEIDETKAKLEKCVMQYEVDALVTEKENSWMKFLKYGVPRYVYLTKDDFEAEKVSAANPGLMRVEGDAIVFDSSAGADISLRKESGPADVYCFKLKMENFKNWMGITPAYNAQLAPRYWIIWKPEQVELQFNDEGLKSQTYYKTVDLSKYNFEEWLDVQLGTVATEQGVWITLKINGDTILDFLDADFSVYSIGNFTINQNGRNGEISIKATDTKYEGQPVPSTTPGVPDMKPEYT